MSTEIKVDKPARVEYENFSEWNEAHPQGAAGHGEHIETQLQEYVKRLNKRDSSQWEIEQRYETNGNIRAVLVNFYAERRRMWWNNASHPRPAYWQKQ